MIFDRIVSKLRNIIAAVVRDIGEAHEKFEERRAASLAEELDKLAKGTNRTNWRQSIEDLVYLVDEDGSFDGRQELWDTMFAEAHAEYTGSYDQNRALHRRFLEELPKRGIPWPKG